MNYNIGSGNQLAYFLNYKDADNKDGQLYVGVKKVSDGTYIVDLGGNQIKGLNGIVTLQWTVTNSSVQIKCTFKLNRYKNRRCARPGTGEGYKKEYPNAK